MLIGVVPKEGLLSSNFTSQVCGWLSNCLFRIMAALIAHQLCPVLLNGDVDPLHQCDQDKDYFRSLEEFINTWSGDLTATNILAPQFSSLGVDVPVSVRKTSIFFDPKKCKSLNVDSDFYVYALTNQLSPSLCCFGSLSVKTTARLLRIVRGCSEIAGRAQPDLFRHYRTRSQREAKSFLADLRHPLCSELLSPSIWLGDLHSQHAKQIHRGTPFFLLPLGSLMSPYHLFIDWNCLVLKFLLQEILTCKESWKILKFVATARTEGRWSLSQLLPGEDTVHSGTVTSSSKWWHSQTKHSTHIHAHWFKKMCLYAFFTSVFACCLLWFMNH